MFTKPATHVWDIPEPEPIAIPDGDDVQRERIQEPDRIERGEPVPALPEPESVPA